MLTCVTKTRTFPCLCSQTCPQKPHPPSVLPNPGDLPVPTFRVTGTECVGHLARKRETSCELRKTFLSSPPNSIFCVVELFVGVSKGVFLGEVGVLRLGQWGAGTVACVQPWGVALCVRVCLPLRTGPGSGMNRAGTNSWLRSEPAGKPASPCFGWHCFCPWLEKKTAPQRGRWRREKLPFLVGSNGRMV